MKKHTLKKLLNKTKNKNHIKKNKNTTRQYKIKRARTIKKSWRGGEENNNSLDESTINPLVKELSIDAPPEYFGNVNYPPIFGVKIPRIPKFYVDPNYKYKGDFADYIVDNRLIDLVPDGFNRMYYAPYFLNDGFGKYVNSRNYDIEETIKLINEGNLNKSQLSQARDRIKRKTIKAAKYVKTFVSMLVPLVEKIQNPESWKKTPDSEKSTAYIFKLFVTKRLPRYIENFNRFVDSYEKSGVNNNK